VHGVRVEASLTRGSSTMTRVQHLATRFFGSLRVRPLRPADLELVRATLRGPELACWERLGPADRAESVATARSAILALGPHSDEKWVAAALLHDVGKAETGLGPFGRSVATVTAMGLGRRRVRSWTNAFGRYVDHDELGATRLREAGARREAVEWAAVHHRPKLWATTDIPPAVCHILAEADGEPNAR
jgi:putative nucleotidyltransferase with HDIG domain